MNFVTAKELTVALESLSEWLVENPDLRLTDIRLGKCNEKEINDFMATVQVIDVKHSTVTVGDSDAMGAIASLLVLYK